jgi:hypothetical protein
VRQSGPASWAPVKRTSQSTTWAGVPLKGRPAASWPVRGHARGWDCSTLRTTPIDQIFHGEDGHTGCALDDGLVVAVDEGAEAEVDEAADEDVIGAVRVQSNGEAQGDCLQLDDGSVGIRSGCEHGLLQADSAGQAASASPADRASSSHRRAALARGPAQREPAPKAGDAWAFALDSRLFQVLDHRDRVRLWPADLEKVERHRAHAARAE